MPHNAYVLRNANPSRVTGVYRADGDLIVCAVYGSRQITPIEKRIHCRKSAVNGICRSADPFGMRLTFELFDSAEKSAVALAPDTDVGYVVRKKTYAPMSSVDKIFDRRKRPFTIIVRDKAAAVGSAALLRL